MKLELDVLFNDETVVSYSDKYFNDFANTVCKVSCYYNAENNDCYIASLSREKLIDTCKFILRMNIVEESGNPENYWISIKELARSCSCDSNCNTEPICLITGTPDAMKRLALVESMMTKGKIVEVCGHYSCPYSYVIDIF